MSLSRKRLRFLTFLISIAAAFNAFGNEQSFRSLDQTNCNGDSAPPIVTLIGEDTICMEVHSIYTDYGATAFDSCEGNVTAHILIYSNVDESHLGTYYCKYVAADSEGNVSDTVVRIVHVIEDYTPPVITFLSQDTTYLEVGDAFRPAHFSAMDNKLGDITDSVRISHQVNTNALGTYLVNYYVETAPNPCGDNNFATVDRVVVVRDLTDPIIRIKNSNPVKIGLHDSLHYLDHILVSDNHCAQQFLLDSMIVLYNDLDTSTAGLYSITLQTKDSAGNLSDPYSVFVLVKDFASIPSIAYSGGNVYPNPTTGTIEISLPFPIVQVRIYSPQGQLLQRPECARSSTVRVSLAGPAGVYWMEVLADDGSLFREKVVKY